MYDRAHVVMLKSTVTNFAWSNPHAQIHFDVQDNKGATEKWMAECPSPSRLSKAGWNGNTLKPGDQVTIIGDQAKDGSNSMRLDHVVLSNGRELEGYGR
jgi:uncharacterized Zn ribbon protein